MQAVGSGWNRGKRDKPRWQDAAAGYYIVRDYTLLKQGQNKPYIQLIWTIKKTT